VTWAPDEIDLASIRVLTASVLARHFAPEFETVTGHSFAEVEALQAKAVATVRQRRSGAGSTSILIGDKRFQFPSRIIRRGPGRSSLLIAVPDTASWARVYSHIDDADRFRDEAVAVLNDHARPFDRVIEFEAESYFDLDRLAVSTARHEQDPSTRKSNALSATDSCGA
jgi:hypothetical protein